MPLYEFICEDCGNGFEKMMRFSETNQQPECPACHGSNTKKQLSLFNSPSFLSSSPSPTAPEGGCDSNPNCPFRCG